MPTLLYFSTVISALGVHCVVEVLLPVFMSSVSCVEVGYIVCLDVCVRVCLCVRASAPVHARWTMGLDLLRFFPFLL
jgi:hypothetical protein